MSDRVALLCTTTAMKTTQHQGNHSVSKSCTLRQNTMRDAVGIEVADQRSALGGGCVGWGRQQNMEVLMDDVMQRQVLTTSAIMDSHRHQPASTIVQVVVEFFNFLL
jgi:hypothetical protein